MSLLFSFGLLFSLHSCGVALFSPEIDGVVSDASCTEGTTLCSFSSSPVTCLQCPLSNESALYPVDRNPLTAWSSVLTSDLTDGEADLTISFTELYEIHSISLLSDIVEPPLQWSIDYFTNGSFRPILALVNDTSTDCIPNYPACQAASTETVSIDERSYYMVQINVFQIIAAESANTAAEVDLRATAVRLNFILPAQGEQFYSVSEVTFQALCTDDNIQNCNDKNRLYRESLAIISNLTTRLLWQQDDAMATLGVWYMDNIRIDGTGDDFESGGLNSTSLVLTVQGGSVQLVPCDQFSLGNGILLTDTGNRSVLLATQQQQQINVTFDLGFLIPNQQCAKDVPVPAVNVYACNERDQCQLIRLYNLNEECGHCSDLRLLQLRNLLSQIKGVTLPPYTILIIANMSDIQVIQSQVTALQGSILDLQLVLVAVERDYGLPSQYPPGVTLPNIVVDIESAFDNTILEDMMFIDELLRNISQFSLLNETAQSVADRSSEVSQLISRIKNPLSVISETNFLLSNLSDLIDRLTRHLENALVAETNGESALSILDRVYTSVREQLSSLHQITLLSFANLMEYTSRSQFHAELARNASNAMDQYRILLSHVVNVSVDVSVNVSRVDNINDLIDSLLDDIENLLLLSTTLSNVTNANIRNTQNILNETETALAITEELIQLVRVNLSSLRRLVLSLSEQIQAYSDELSLYLPINYPQPCTASNLSSSCTEGERHSILLSMAVSRIENERLSTVAYANEFIDSIGDLSEAEFAAINETAQNSITNSNNVLTSLGLVDLIQLDRLAVDLRSSIVTLSTDITQFESVTEVINEDANTQYNRSLELSAQYSTLLSDLTSLNRDIVDLDNTTPNYTEGANEVGNDANELLLVLESTNNTLSTVESSIVSLDNDILVLAETFNRTRVALQDINSEADSIQDILSTTEAVINGTRSGLSDALQQNTDIISEIDTLLTNVAETHKLAKKINLLLRLAPNNSVAPYVSLQPPPTTTNITNQIQFESLDIYLFADSSYSEPALLFYAGPIAKQENTAILQREDYIALTSELPNVLRLQWRIGATTGSVRRVFDITARAEVYFTRAGSMFELQVVQGDNVPVQHTTVNNASLLFTATENTVFLVGGRPPLSSLAISGSYLSFTGQVYLLLFNGALWSLWDYRDRLTVSDIGNIRQFEGVTNNVWFPGSGQLLYTLSFDGDGYIRPINFVPGTLTFVREDTINFQINTKSLEGLIAYLFDPVVNVTIQLALLDGNVRLRVANRSQSVNLAVPIGQQDFLGITYSIFTLRNTLSIQLTGKSEAVIGDMESNFFSDLSRVVAWFGGIDEQLFNEHLLAGSDPPITTRRYHGCVDIALNRNNLFSSSNNFTGNYLSSPVQRGVSGTCMRSESVHQVGFNGEGFLSYGRFQFIPKVNEDGINSARFVELSNVAVFSFSFYPVTRDGVILSATDSANIILIELIARQINVILTADGTSATLSSPVITLNQWHYLLLEIGSSNYTLYLDNVVVPSSTEPADFTFTVGSNNRLTIGGTSGRNNFTGCMNDISYNFKSILLIGDALNEYRTPPGVTFYSCPYFVEQSSALVGVFADTPQERSCFLTPPTVFNETIGGFHAYSSLLSYNSLSLRASSWKLSYSLRRLSGDGHVMTISSQPTRGTITLRLRSGRVILELTGADNQTQSLTSSSPIPPNTWTNIVLTGNLSNEVLLVSLLLDNALVGSVSTAYSAVRFQPQVPLVFGYKRNVCLIQYIRVICDMSPVQVLGFVGCLRDLMINDNSSSFDQEDLSSCLPCYVRSTNGWGFSGLSYIMETLSPAGISVQYQISMQFRPSREHGLLLLLTDTTDARTPLLGIGLYEGNLRVTNFSSPGAFMTVSTQSFCSSQVQSRFYSLNVSVVANSMTVALDGSQTVAVSTVRPFSSVSVYIGGLPTFGLYPRDTTVFSFLISDDNGIPPRFVGCLLQVDARSTPDGTNQLDTISQADVATEVMVGNCPSP